MICTKVLAICRELNIINLLIIFFISAEEEKAIIIENSNSRVELITQKPLAELSMEEIGTWLANLGLECYAGELRRWGATGSKLFDCSQQQLEKEIEIKNVFHKKKLLYAIESEKSGSDKFLGADKVLFIILY